MAYHLAQQGWKEIVLIDKGPLPNPGGSTGHASNFIFLTDHSKEMTLFTLDSVRQYKELGVFTQSGGVEVARTAERMDELKRRMASSKAWGIDAELVSPAEVKRLVPFINEKIILGAMDTNGHGRQHGGDLEVGAYAHRPILWEPDDIPSLGQSKLSPTELPFTKEDFDESLEHALELIPDILGDPSVGIRHAINGLLSLTPDGLPLLGETPEVKGLWSVAAIWIKEAPGIARCVAEWMTSGVPEIDPSGSDIARFYDHQKTRAHIQGRTAEGFNKTYGIVHPREQWESNRRVRLSPFYEREKALGAVFFETAGWERPNWYASNKPLLEEYGERVMPRRYEWDARWWSPIINAEHLAMRDRVGMVDLSAFAVFDIAGSCALDYMQKMCVVQVNVPVGRVTYTSLLNTAGGIKADLTVMRLGSNHFRVVTGGADGMRDRKWFSDHLPEDGAVQITDLTSSWATIGVWGPRARDLLLSITDADVSNEGFPFGTCRLIDLGPVRALASRISYVGELGWEIYVPFEQGARLWDAIWQAGQPFRIAPVGIGVCGTTGGLEKCFLPPEHAKVGTKLKVEYFGEQYPATVAVVGPTPLFDPQNTRVRS